MWSRHLFERKITFCECSYATSILYDTVAVGLALCKTYGDRSRVLIIPGAAYQIKILSPVWFFPSLDCHTSNHIKLTQYLEAHHHQCHHSSVYGGEVNQMQSCQATRLVLDKVNCHCRSTSFMCCDVERLWNILQHVSYTVMCTCLIVSLSCISNPKESSSFSTSVDMLVKSSFPLILASINHSTDQQSCYRGQRIQTE